MVVRLADLYPDCVHVREVGLERAPDEAVWNYARENGFTIVTNDADLRVIPSQNNLASFQFLTFC
jgi:predicted nuclease of predicted toxin-antitoxin system